MLIEEKESIEKNVTVPRKGVASGNNTKCVTQDFTIYEDLADEDFFKYLISNFDTVTMNGEIHNQPKEDSYSNFEDFLEDIDKEEEGIFANIVFPNSSYVVELCSDKIYEAIGC